MNDASFPRLAADMVVFNDLQAQRRRLKGRIEAAITRVLDHGQFIMGPEVVELESRLANWCGTRHAITCSSGTEALILVLRAKGIGPGDAVLVPSFTFAATAEAVALVGATPVFVDVLENTFNLDPDGIAAGVVAARRYGCAARALIVVDLFGQPACYDEIEPVAREHGLWLVADAAQSFGAEYKGRRVGCIGDVVTTSFFPAKPLGCYGDGGAVFTDEDSIAELVRSLRVHGKGKDKYDNVRIGTNGRLDTIQAAVLIEKLGVFGEELVARQAIARRYDEGFRGGVIQTPSVIEGAVSTWAQYTVVLEDRDAVAARLRASGVPTAVYYPKPLHRQPAFANYPVADGALPRSSQLSDRVLSLPMHAYLDPPTQSSVIEAVRWAVGSG